ncbi:MAG: hypothetical protein ABSB95_10175 [Dissulfurispiraceae bacterium]|jgi:DUF1680 family protein
MIKKKIPCYSEVPVVLSVKERDLVRDETFCDPEFGRVGVVEGDKIKLMMTLDDIEDVLGHIASVTNNTKDKKLEKELDKIYDKLQKVMDGYEEVEDMD